MGGTAGGWPVIGGDGLGDDGNEPAGAGQVPVAGGKAVEGEAAVPGGGGKVPGRPRDGAAGPYERDGAEAGGLDGEGREGLDHKPPRDGWPCP